MSSIDSVGLSLPPLQVELVFVSYFMLLFVGENVG